MYDSKKTAASLVQVKYEPYHELIHELKAEGKVRFSGLSNHGADYSLSGRLDDAMEDVILSAAQDGRFDIVLCTYNFYIRTQRREKMARLEYAKLGGRNAGACAECSGPCEKACPYGVPIQGRLALAHETLTLP